MRIVATADTHFPFTPDKIPDGDVFIHAGDLMYTGYPDEWASRLASLAALPHKTKLFIPGNHDFHIQNYEGVARAELRKAGVKLVGIGRNRTVMLPNGYRMLGIPYVTNIEGWAYNVSEEWLQDYLEQYKDIDVVVSHAPPYKILDMVPGGKEGKFDSIGGLAANRWFYKQENKPKVWVCGHIHESYGHVTLEGCEFHNVAMCDALYGQTNPVRIIDL